MATSNKINLTGLSGTVYTFDICAKGASFNHVSAVYAFAQLWQTASGNLDGKIFYIGESCDLANRLCGHEKLALANWMGCTHILAKYISGENQRKAVEEDLIREFKPQLNSEYCGR